VELTEPRKALDEAGAQTQIVSPKNGRVRSYSESSIVQSAASIGEEPLQNLVAPRALSR
jgi:hypothetical protein